ncbi:hypothetical protein ACFY93_10360 [Streptomyces sp. NPDC008313]|uniref:hypothetical protein n=1 Tax=Streptomyces sp. NPDC008313 TaxID=3364826 RepID=UPI0036E037DD
MRTRIALATALAAAALLGSAGTALADPPANPMDLMKPALAAPAQGVGLAGGLMTQAAHPMEMVAPLLAPSQS